jgi:RsmE family RNA methyltransferase
VNVLLFEPGELLPDGTVHLSGRRAAHVREVLRSGPGDEVQVGMVGGLMGAARILAAGAGELVLAPRLDRPPPPPAPVSLLLAVPRPKILRRVLQASAAMGVKRVALLGSYRVEKSYFSSPVLAREAVREELLRGLEQGRDTVLPEVTLHRTFKPFLEDELEALFPEPARLLAHPADTRPLEAERPAGRRAALAIGPEGGWTPYEARRLGEKGFRPVSLGPRPLRVDAAVPYAVGQVELWLRVRSSGPRGPCGRL